MIDIKLAKEEFLDYTSKFDLNNANIQRKVNHSLRVAKICKNIAISLKLEKEDILLAELIGLLHDIGRFEQYTKYNTFNDEKSINHGLLGVNILENDQYIRKYINNPDYDKVIKIAVKNHNGYRIENNLNEREMLFTKIVKDADKIDIFYEATEIFWKDKEEKINECKISKKVYNEFMNQNLVENSFKENELDKLIGIISFIYDINYMESFCIIRDNMYVEKIIRRFDFKDEETKEEMKKIEEITRKYIKERLNK